MRIIGGAWRGRTIRAPRGEATRPTTDRVREALFSVITSRLEGGWSGVRVLDAFAGSGALGLEALSRGAASATLVESDRAALGAVRGNVATLSAETANVVPGDVFALAKRGALGPFALILIDAPYTLDPARIRELLTTLAEAGSVETGALVTWEHAHGTGADWPEGYVPEGRKRYGSTEIDLAIYEGSTTA